MPYLTRKGQKERIYYDYSVEVPYDKTAEGSVKLYLKRVEGEKRSQHGPEIPDYFETVAWDGHLYDDDLPDLEDEAMVMIADFEHGNSHNGKVFCRG